MQRLNLDVPGLGEVRCSDVECIATSDGGQTTERGVGLMLSKPFKPCLIGYWAISEMVLLFRVKDKPFTLCIIQVYAPTSEHEEEEVDRFYEEVNLARE